MSKSVDLFEQFATDDSKEIDGVYVEYMGYEFLIARLGNRKYGKKLTALVERHDKALSRKDEAADKLNDDLMIETLAETILLGWKGEITFKGESLAYSVDNAKKLLTMKDFRKEVVKMADDMEAYKAQQEAELGKP